MFYHDISGTTWTQELIWMIMNNLDFEGGKEDIHYRVPFLELSWYKDNAESFYLEPLRDNIGYIKKKYQSGPVCLKTHMPWVFLPKDIQEGLKKTKIIYVVRNPKDAALSLYHFMKALGECNEPVDDFLENFIAGNAVYLPYWSHVLEFWEQRHKPNVMILRYEEMLKDLPGMIRKVASFLEKPLTDDQVDQLVKHLSFDSMKTNSAVNNEKLIKERRQIKGLGEAQTGHMRRGQAKSHKAEMSPEMIEKFDEWINVNTKNTDFVVE
ncbi:unnamed protein product [Acanthoscelides obtectus]|uniref:Sulfotransferase domain-containing protein n=1 Tax=Acanthoscelides obtectus TaxID=200917 RepID=A0A9P0M3T3_ACAOB|nr:unnamed protein product [Acanthoscelides obtectus]CAK1665468.1 Sulfotransferase family cytosolic 1B member 1 [Acanthoscelides obtectus]